MIIMNDDNDDDDEDGYDDGYGDRQTISLILAQQQ